MYYTSSFFNIGCNKPFLSSYFKGTRLINVTPDKNKNERNQYERIKKNGYFCKPK